MILQFGPALQPSPNNFYFIWWCIILGLPGLPNCINLLIINHINTRKCKLSSLGHCLVYQLETIFCFFPKQFYQPTNSTQPNLTQPNPTQPNPIQPTTNIFLAPSGTVKKTQYNPIVAYNFNRNARAESHPKKIQKVCYDPRF